MRQKYEVKILQSAKTSELSDKAFRPRIPEASTSESDDSNASIWVKILDDRVVIKGSAPKSSRIYEVPVSESDDEDDEGLGLFGD